MKLKTLSWCVASAWITAGVLLALAGCGWRERGARPESPLPYSPIATQAASLLPTATPYTPFTATPYAPPTAIATVASASPALERAPDFSLPQGGGGWFALSEQLARGPVVLVFLHHVGG